MNNEFNKVCDSGERRDFATGSVRDVRRGKGRFDLRPPHAQTRIAKHYENGAVKYDDRNWEKGQPLSIYLDSAARHINHILSGDIDEDHAAAVCWNMEALMETKYRIELGILPKELNDLPDPYNQENKDEQNRT